MFVFISSHYTNSSKLRCEHMRLNYAFCTQASVSYSFKENISENIADNAMEELAYQAAGRRR